MTSRARRPLPFQFAHHHPPPPHHHPRAPSPIQHARYAHGCLFIQCADGRTMAQQTPRACHLCRNLVRLFIFLKASLFGGQHLCVRDAPGKKGNAKAAAFPNPLRTLRRQHFGYLARASNAVYEGSSLSFETRPRTALRFSIKCCRSTEAIAKRIFSARNK